MKSRATGFTLVELLVVIAIIGILVALLLPAVQAAREAARRNECLNNLKQMGVALQTHHDSRKHLPAGRSETTQTSVSWAFELLPYMEEPQIHSSRNKTKRVDDEANAPAMRTPVETYYCPSKRTPAADRDFDNDDSPALVTGVAAGGDYAANPGHNLLEGMDEVTRRPLGRLPRERVGPIFTYSKVSLRRVTDGTSVTYAVAEKHLPPEPAEAAPGTVHYLMADTAIFGGDRAETVLRGSENGIAANSQEPSSEKMGSAHPSVVQAVFLDGHVEGLDRATEPEVLKVLSAIGDGEVVPDRDR